MDNEQILLDLYKQQQYSETRTKIQKLFMTISGTGSAIAMVMSMIYFTQWIYVAAFGGTVVCVAIVSLLYQLKKIRLSTACLITMLYSCFVFIPPFWFLTTIAGGAPYVSIIILVSMITLYSGKALKWLLLGYGAVLIFLVVHSFLTDLPDADYAYAIYYNIAGFVTAVISIILYMLFKQNQFNELNDKFLRSSFRDELTQLYNRKLLDLILNYQESLYKHQHENYSMMMMDVDGFKEMNDAHGHVFGDIVLRSIAECISEITRTSDFVVRFGGDEILIIQSKASESSMKTFIDRINEKMKTSCQLEIPIGISYGYAMRSECETPDAVLKLADERMYTQKTAKKADR
ncbi:MAG TPA: diguanylate cyclase [Candidatus Limiplasma sp.]|nr:diguanylate cyclase [Candidatus Limiplasma sp.]HRX09323.1 diguanylate cyclase [Candidatus Limiplasma sp.]